MIQVLVAALEQEESKYCWQSHRGILSLLNHFQRTWLCRCLPMSQRRAWEVHQCLYLQMCWELMSFPEVITLTSRNTSFVWQFASQQRTTNSSSQPVQSGFLLESLFFKAVWFVVPANLSDQGKKAKVENLLTWVSFSGSQVGHIMLQRFLLLWRVFSVCKQSQAWCVTSGRFSYHGLNYMAVEMPFMIFIRIHSINKKYEMFKIFSP